VPTGESGFLEGLNIRIGIDLPQGASFVSGTAHYRPGGTAVFESTPVDFEDENVFAVLPDSVVGSCGVEYWIEIQTLTTTLTDPRRDPDQKPHTIRVSIDDMSESGTFPGERYRMVSVPLDFGADFTGTLASILSDQPEFGPYDPFRWRCFRFAPGDAAYAELIDDGTENLFYLKPGRGFWLISLNAHSISTAPITGTSVATHEPYEITLEPGWNQIGHPFVFPVEWSLMSVDTFTAPEAVDSGVVQVPVALAGDGTYDYEVSALAPFEGYWLKNLSPSPVVLAVPPVEAVTMEPVNTPDGESDDTPANNWTLRIIASSGEVLDRFNIVGVHANASAEWDPQDRSEAPMGPGPMLSLYFPHHSWKTRSGVYTTDVRAAYEAIETDLTNKIELTQGAWGHAWHFDVAKTFAREPVGDEMTLEFEGVDDVPFEAEVFLIDHILNHVTNLRRENRYVFYLTTRGIVESDNDTRFTLVVGSEAFVGDTPLPPLPATTALHQNYPNPFNPTTLIRYDIAAPGDVTISVYDARGALVKDLYRGPRSPGRYVVSWTGDNQAGQQVASGIYFYRLQTPALTQTRKMVLLK
jgi:hypothetical protein